LGDGRKKEASVKIVFGFLLAYLVLVALGGFAGWGGAHNVALALWTLSLLVMSAMLYRLREMWRAWYGGMEFGVALVGFFLVLKSFYENLHGMADESILTRMAILFAAVYVMIRALDNIGTGLKGTKFEGRWKAIFQIGS
jgi:hypothetical protein